MNINDEDIKLWEAYQQGDREAFGKLFRKFYQPLFQFGSKLTVNHELLEDCIQELFAELWQKKNRAEVQSVKAYLLKAVRYKLFRALQKKRGLTVTAITDDMGFELSPETLIIGEQEEQARQLKLVHALRQLSARQKEIIYLKYFQELNYEEVSEIMNINYQVARNLLYQSVKALKNILLALLFYLCYFDNLK